MWYHLVFLPQTLFADVSGELCPAVVGGVEKTPRQLFDTVSKCCQNFGDGAVRTNHPVRTDLTEDWL